MRISEFWWECTKRAFSGKLARAEFVSGILCLLAIPLGTYWKAPVEDLNWVPFYIFGTAFVLFVGWGYIRAPRDLHQEAMAEIGALSLKLDNREERQAALTALWQLRSDGITRVDLLKHCGCNGVVDPLLHHVFNKTGVGMLKELLLEQGLFALVWTFVVFMFLAVPLMVVVGWSGC